MEIFKQNFLNALENSLNPKANQEISRENLLSSVRQLVQNLSKNQSSALLNQWVEQMKNATDQDIFNFVQDLSKSASQNPSTSNKQDFVSQLVTYLQKQVSSNETQDQWSPTNLDNPTSELNQPLTSQTKVLWNQILGQDSSTLQNNPKQLTSIITSALNLWQQLTSPKAKSSLSPAESRNLQDKIASFIKQNIGNIPQIPLQNNMQGQSQINPIWNQKSNQTPVNALLVLYEKNGEIPKPDQSEFNDTDSSQEEQTVESPPPNSTATPLSSAEASRFKIILENGESFDFLSQEQIQPPRIYGQQTLNSPNQVERTSINPSPVRNESIQTPTAQPVLTESNQLIQEDLNSDQAANIPAINIRNKAYQDIKQIALKVLQQALANPSDSENAIDLTPARISLAPGQKAYGLSSNSMLNISIQTNTTDPQTKQQLQFGLLVKSEVNDSLKLIPLDAKVSQELATFALTESNPLSPQLAQHAQDLENFGVDIEAIQSQSKDLIQNLMTALKNLSQSTEALKTDPEFRQLLLAHTLVDSNAPTDLKQGGDQIQNIKQSFEINHFEQPLRNLISAQDSEQNSLLEKTLEQIWPKDKSLLTEKDFHQQLQKIVNQSQSEISQLPLNIRQEVHSQAQKILKQININKWSQSNQSDDSSHSKNQQNIYWQENGQLRQGELQWEMGESGNGDGSSKKTMGFALKTNAPTLGQISIRFRAEDEQVDLNLREEKGLGSLYLQERPQLAQSLSQIGLHLRQLLIETPQIVQRENKSNFNSLNGVDIKA